MLYRPNFCCECGIKIERSEWKIYTDRRFCESCEIEKKEYVLFPKIFAAFLGLFALVGVAGFFKSSEKPLNIAKSQVALSDLPKNNAVAVKNVVQNDIRNTTEQTLSANKQIEPKSAENLRPETNAVSGNAVKPEVAEAIYYCGAKTKKGTACTRRVKGGGRCWQHEGQTAMFANEKLLVK